MYSKMLVPVDGSAASKLALSEAIRLAQSLKSSVQLIHVVDVWPMIASSAAAASYDIVFDLQRREGAHLLSDSAATVREAGLAVDTILTESPDMPVGECIVRKACEHQAELIICGTHGRRGVRRMLMGSDAEYIVRHAPVPVLLVRIQDQPGGKIGSGAG